MNVNDNGKVLVFLPLNPLTVPLKDCGALSHPSNRYVCHTKTTQRNYAYYSCNDGSDVVGKYHCYCHRSDKGQVMLLNKWSAWGY